MANPWALRHFLSYGTLHIAVPDLEHDSQLTGQRLAEDGWNSFAAAQFLRYIHDQDDHALLCALDFLVLQEFISASFLLVGTASILIRIYLIPYDLPGVQGRLRVRRDEVVGRARRCLAGLLPKISRNHECWEGRSVPDAPVVVPGTTLTAIYEDLPSPQGHLTAASTPVTRRLLDFSDELTNLGMRSKLHRYQRRTVAAMIQKESDVTDDPDPLYLPVTGMNGEQLFLQPGTLEVLLERPRVAPCRGGILCEELGTGKTVMILGLILSTINQISEPEPSILDRRPVLTPLAFRHFPSEEFANARARFNSLRGKRKADGRVPTLIEILLHKLTTNPVAFVSEHKSTRYDTLKEDVENLEQYLQPRKDNLPFYLDYQSEPVDNERTNKRGRGARGGPKMLYLTSATLVIVPPNLLLQWTQECYHHCDDSLRICVLEGGNEGPRVPIPPARTMASEYDIVLMTYPRFTAEADGQADWTWSPCTCAEYPTVRVPKCVCKPPSCSPLLQIRWKRLVIDEGHVAASLSTKLTQFTKNVLSVERRWIVTGTPTTNLLGLKFGMKVNEATIPASEEEETMEVDADEGGEIASSPVASEEAEGTEDDGAPSSAPRVWTRADGEDLTKLGNMLGHFVGVPQLLANTQLFGTHVTDALLDKRGPRIGAIDVLMQLMSSVMFRHRIADVEQEVTLPPVEQELVLLDLDPLAITSYNAMQATIAINAVTSEREDKDYMFHRSNVAALQETVQNMTQLMFWRVDDNFYSARELLRRSEELLTTLTPTTSPEDVKLMNDALHHLKVADSDPLWCAVQRHEDVPYRVYDLAEPIFKAWTREGLSTDSDDTSDGYIHPDRLQHMRTIVFKQPLISQDTLVNVGLSGSKLDAKIRAAYEDELKRKKGPQISRSQIKATKAAQKSGDANTVKEMQTELAAQVSPEVHLPTPQLHERRHDIRPSELVRRSPIARTRLGNSASSKLNFIIDEVSKYSPTEKFLIFSESPLTLAHIGEALELIGVGYKRFTTEVKAAVRKQSVLTFETSEKFRVFLMELKHGARGLNLIAASRVIFCEPVWRADVESQAIKRCHRIGQTRPITVKTLAIRATAEENMAVRKMALKDSSEKPKLLDENGIRSFIANPKFLTQTPTALPVVEFPLVNFPPASEEPEDVSMAEVEEHTSRVVVRQVRFTADDGSPSGSLKRPAPDDTTPPRKRQVRLLLPSADNNNPPSSLTLPQFEPKPRARVRFA
ncbi:P-loop containing nucleoside triphosphate hydrolase protein [Mycena vitilis]|nr:P-loop containing nucleoside triphosphate hydrolase protein [Mycena vitilis]